MYQIEEDWNEHACATSRGVVDEQERGARLRGDARSEALAVLRVKGDANGLHDVAVRELAEKLARSVGRVAGAVERAAACHDARVAELLAKGLWQLQQRWWVRHCTLGSGQTRNVGAPRLKTECTLARVPQAALTLQ